MIPDKVRLVLEQHGLEALELETGSTPTSEMAAAKISCEVGQIAKSMLFNGKDGRFRLIVCAGDKRGDNKNLKAALGVKARFATAEETESETGFRPGGVCPFGIGHLPFSSMTNCPGSRSSTRSLVMTPLEYRSVSVPYESW